MLSHRNFLLKRGHERVVIMKVFAFIILVLVLTQPSFANDNQELMALSKFTGACGILDSLIVFQTTTKFEEGKEFVYRFWSVEAARLGMESAEKLMEVCLEVVPKYDALWSAYGRMEKGGK